MDELTRMRALESIANSVILQRLPASPHGKLIGSLIAHARRSAIAAMAAMCTVDPEKPANIRSLQQQVAIYQQIMDWAEQTIVEGNEAFSEVTKEEQQELMEILGRNTGDEDA